MSDAEAFEHYDDPAKREPAPGAPRRRSKRPLTQHVPVRFPPETIEQVRRLADAAGMTVRGWLRGGVARPLPQQGAAEVARADAGAAARPVVERLQRDVADLAAALDRSSQPR